MSRDPYEILGVSPEADIETIKLRYRQLVRENHPDIAEDKAAANARMVLILDAWRVLADPEKRGRLDHDRLAAAERARIAAVAAQARVAPSAPRSSSGARPSVSRQPGKTKSRSGSSSSGRTHSSRAKLLLQVNEAAQLCFREGRPEEAIQLCQRVLRSDRNNMEALILMGDIHVAQGDINSAVVIYERALLVQPNNMVVRRKRDTLQPPPVDLNPAQWRQPPQEAPPKQPSSLLGRLKARLSSR